MKAYREGSNIFKTNNCILSTKVVSAAFCFDGYSSYLRLAFTFTVSGLAISHESLKTSERSTGV